MGKAKTKKKAVRAPAKRGSTRSASPGRATAAVPGAAKMAVPKADLTRLSSAPRLLRIEAADVAALGRGLMAALENLEVPRAGALRLVVDGRVAHEAMRDGPREGRDTPPPLLDAHVTSATLRHALHEGFAHPVELLLRGGVRVTGDVDFLHVAAPVAATWLLERAQEAR